MTVIRVGGPDAAKLLGGLVTNRLPEPGAPRVPLAPDT